MAYGVWCRVSGGVTGTREAWMKEDGIVKRFPTKEDAEAEAARMLNSISQAAKDRADFGYSARIMSDE